MEHITYSYFCPISFYYLRTTLVFLYGHLYRISELSQFMNKKTDVILTNIQYSIWL